MATTGGSTQGEFEKVQETAAFIRGRIGARAPRVAVVLGSGLGGFADLFEDRVVLAYADIPHFPHASVAGHAGRLVVGRLGGEWMVAMQGRVHAYEGHTPAEVAFPARVLCALGVRALVVTNASGGIRQGFKPGDLMVINDHINLSSWNPLNGPNDERFGPRFPDMSEAYAKPLRALLHASAQRTGVAVHEGVYVMLQGPTYETPAEIRMLRTLGADAVGMSTVPEVIAARHMGVPVAGVACITNLASGMGDQPLSHEDVAVVASQARERFQRLLADFLPAAARA